MTTEPSLQAETHLMNGIDASSVKKYPLCEGCLAGVNVSRNTNVANSSQKAVLRHIWLWQCTEASANGISDSQFKWVLGFNTPFSIRYNETCNYEDKLLYSSNAKDMSLRLTIPLPFYAQQKSSAFQWLQSMGVFSKPILGGQADCIWQQQQVNVNGN